MIDRLEPRTLPATFLVNSLVDAIDAQPGDGVALTSGGLTTLRAAVMEANALEGADLIILRAGVYRLSTYGENGVETDAKGDLDVFDAIAIRGAGAGQSAIFGDGGSRLFDFNNAGSVTLSGLTFSGGRDEYGGAVRARGATQLTLLSSTLRDNRATKSGGALAVTASAASIADCFFERNSAGDRGGAVYAENSALNLLTSTIAGNIARSGGGASALGGTSVLSRSTWSGNHAGARGGAIESSGENVLHIDSSTLVANTATIGGGIATDGIVEIGNTILAGNAATTGLDGRGVFHSLGFNLIGNATGSAGFFAAGDLAGSNIHSLDPQLTALSFFGGQTPTHVPLPGSAALDAGSTTDAFDQRGIARPSALADIGAVEARTFTIARIASPSSAAVGTSYGRLRVQLREGDIPLPGAIVTFSAPTEGPGGSFAGPASVITDADGVAASPMFLANAAAGEYQVRASLAPGLGLDFALRNLPGAATRIDVQGPTAPRAGEPIALILTVRDSFGNIVTDYEDELTVTSSDSRAVLPAQIQFQKADRGTATVPLTLRTSGAQTVRFASGRLGAKFTPLVTPAAASRLELSMAATAVAGVATPLTLTLRDEFGNVATESAGPVTFSSTDQNATTPSNVHTATDRGTRTFMVTFRTAGPQTLTVRAAGLQTSADITVTPAAAVRFDLNGPATGVAGEAVPLTVTARDAFGNVASGMSGHVDFLSDDARSTLPTGQSFGPNDAGVKQFLLTFRTAGARSVTLGAAGLNATYRVALTAAALDHFTLTGPANVDEGAPFTLTIRAFDAFGNVVNHYAGTVGISSNDSRADLPGPIEFTAANAGVRTVAGLALRTPGARSLQVRDAAAGVQADVAIAVANLGPRDLTLTTDRSSLIEGQSLTLSGSFGNSDAADAHTVVIRWGDGSPDTTLNLAAGDTTFSADHVFTGSAPSAGIHVEVTDADGGAIAADRSVAIANAPPTIAVPNARAGSAIGRIGDTFILDGTFADPGLDAWTATVDYGDGRGPQSLALTADKRFQLRHVYTAEGTFTVVVNVMDDEGGRATFSERVAVLLPGTVNVRVIVIGPGETGHINTSTYDVEFVNGSTTTPAVFLAGLVDANSIGGLAGGPDVADGGRVIAVDFRALDADPSSTLTIVLHYDPTGVTPELKYFDPETGAFVPVRGSSRFPNSFVVDRDKHTVTVTLDGSTSSPTLAKLNGTLFTLTVPAPPPVAPAPTPTPVPQQAFFVQANRIGPGTPSDAAGLRPTAAITGLSSGGELTLTLSSSDGLRRGGADGETSTGGLPLPSVLQFVRRIYEVRSALAEVIRMWLDHPIPIEAPALLPPPPADDVWQVSLDVPGAVQHDAELEKPPAEERTLLIDASAAVAEHQPWWLADAAPASPVAADTDNAVALPQITSEPTDDERTAAAIAAIWIGGHALAISAPEVPAEDRGRDPVRRVRPKLRARLEKD